MQDLKNVENAVIGFHATDLDGRLNYYDGSTWKKYLIVGEEGSGGGGASAYIDLIDAATVNLPTINTPLKNALAGKLNSDFSNPTYTIYDDPADHSNFLMGGDGSGVAVVTPEQAKEQLNTTFQEVVDASMGEDSGNVLIDFGDSWSSFTFPSGAGIEDDGGSFTISSGGNTDMRFTGHSRGIEFYSNSLIIRDNTPSPTGIQYNSDYSATYTNRSLVDKEYVDNVVASSGDGHQKTFIKTFANPDTGDINIDTTESSVGDEWIITYQDSLMPTIVLDGSKKARIIDVGVDFQSNVKSRIYLHLVEIVGTDYYFDTTITPITILS